MEHRLKILAPAGDTEMLRAAVYSGADSVYLGVKGFNARRSAQNFEGDGLAEAVAFCHARNCAVYAAINTLVLPGREDAMEQAVQAAATAGCDAVIVQDLATAAAVRSAAPGLPLHASTQMSVHSLAGVRQLAEMGFSRAILARELTEDELAHIAAHSPIELEVFVHGALCVSVSGQCYASAFLGGRSANRGGCAGPCRLPFRALCAEYSPQANASPMRGDGHPGRGAPEPQRRQGRRAADGLVDAVCNEPGRPHDKHKPATDTYHLSMRDLSILDALPRLEAMGIAAAKIEGRLRGPEYCAVAVDSARRALDGQPYDKQLLQDIFSRSGFTGGWFTGEATGETATKTWCGARSEADAEATRAALPKARELYRRERPRVPVEMALRFDSDGGKLTVTDGTHTVRREFDGPLPLAEGDPAPALAEALAKTGGTPFYLPDDRPPVVKAGGAFLPAREAGRLRREALEELLALRQQPAPAKAAKPSASSWGLIGDSGTEGLLRQAREVRAGTGRPLLFARFEHVAQLPDDAGALCAGLVLPLEEAAAVPEGLRAKTWLWLPRVLFGGAEETAARQIDAAKDLGFAGFEAGNLAHLWLCRGLPMLGGFGLNLTNAFAAASMAAMGCKAVTLSPELSLAQLRQLAAADQLAGVLPTAALAYGHLPLMLTRACPLQNADDHAGCIGCDHGGLLADRTGRAFPVLCRHGARCLLNPVPLWMGDRLAQLPTDIALLYFTAESQSQAGTVLHAFDQGQAAPGEFTRGLYPRGTEG